MKFLTVNNKNFQANKFDSLHRYDRDRKDRYETDETKLNRRRHGDADREYYDREDYKNSLRRRREKVREVDDDEYAKSDREHRDHRERRHRRDKYFPEDDEYLKSDRERKRKDRDEKDERRRKGMEIFETIRLNQIHLFFISIKMTDMIAKDATEIAEETKGADVMTKITINKGALGPRVVVVIEKIHDTQQITTNNQVITSLISSEKDTETKRSISQVTITMRWLIISNTNNISNIYVVRIRKPTLNGTIVYFTLRAKLHRNEIPQRQTVVRVSILVVVQSMRTGLSCLPFFNFE